MKVIESVIVISLLNKRKFVYIFFSIFVWMKKKKTILYWNFKIYLSNIPRSCPLVHKRLFIYPIYRIVIFIQRGLNRVENTKMIMWKKGTVQYKLIYIPENWILKQDTYILNLKHYFCRIFLQYLCKIDQMFMLGVILRHLVLA